MLDSILVAQQNALPGRDDDYNDWYTNIHIRDVMRLDGAIAVRRFRVHDLQVTRGGVLQAPKHRYFTVYELSDLEAVLQGHLRHARTERMQISTAGDFTDPSAYFFLPHKDSSGAPAAPPASGPMVAGRFQVAADRHQAFEQWFDSAHRRDVSRQPGFESTALFRIADRQMAPSPSPVHYLALYGVSDMKAAVFAMAAAFPEGSSPGRSVSPPYLTVAIGCYEPLIERLSAESVRNATEAERAVEAAARARLGDRVMTRATATFRASS